MYFFNACVGWFLAFHSRPCGPTFEDVGAETVCVRRGWDGVEGSCVCWGLVVSDAQLEIRHLSLAATFAV